MVIFEMRIIDCVFPVFFEMLILFTYEQKKYLRFYFMKLRNRVDLFGCLINFFVHEIHDALKYRYHIDFFLYGWLFLYQWLKFIISYFMSSDHQKVLYFVIYFKFLFEKRRFINVNDVKFYIKESIVLCTLVIFFKIAH